MREVLFIRSEGDSSLWGALMYFRSADDFKNYKTSGPYKKLVESLRKAWLDESKPVSDQIYKIQDIWERSENLTIPSIFFLCTNSDADSCRTI